MYCFLSPLIDPKHVDDVFNSLLGDFGSIVAFISIGRYSVADTHTCNMHPPNIKIVPWKPKFWIKYSISMGKTKLPAAVPDTQMPLASARRLLK